MPEQQYPAMSTYSINDFFSAQKELKEVVDKVWTIKEQCELVCFCRGDLSGRVYGWVSNGQEEAAKLLAEFERKASAFKEATAKLKKELPEPDFIFFTEYTDSIDHDRKCIEGWYKEIQQFFDLSHKYYEQYPAPKCEKVSGLQNLILLAAYASLAYTVYHMFF